MTHQEFPAARMEYRLSRYVLQVGVVAALLFALMGIVSTVGALSNSDGSFRHPVAAAVIFGLFWSCQTLFCCWQILAYYRHRLFVSPELVRAVGCFATREVRLVSVTRAVWRSLFKGGSLVLHEASSRGSIQFSNYTIQERVELIRFFRQALAGHCQEGWERFESSCIPSAIDYKKLRTRIHGHLRFAVIAWAAALPAMYALLIWPKLVDGLPNGNWIIVALLPIVIAGAMLGLMWFAASVDLAQARDRHDAA